MKILLAYDGSRHARRAVEFIAARSPLAGRDPTIWLLDVQPPLLTEVPLATTRKRVSALYARRADGVLRPTRTMLKRAGLDVGKVISVISKGAAQSWQMENRWKTMNEVKFDGFGFAVDWMRKDLGICLEEAERNGARLPATALIDQFYKNVQQRSCAP